MKANEANLFRRPQLEQAAPVRNAGGFFRTAEGAKGLGGVPLVSAEHAVVAAVRMAYKVAEAQIDRSARLARRLQDAGDESVGPKSGRQALDATEQLVFRALMAVLSWLEGFAAEEGSPIKRLATAQYELLGSLIGLTRRETAKASDAGHAEETSEHRDDTTARPEPAAARSSAAARRSLRIVHKKARNAVPCALPRSRSMPVSPTKI